jgi:hypothetical protein
MGITIVSLLNQVFAGRKVLVALCSEAHDDPLLKLGCGQMESPSGVFASFADMPRGQQSLPAVRSQQFSDRPFPSFSLSP